MANKAILQVTAELNKQKTQQMLQKQLDTIGKSLKLVIAYDAQAEAGNKKNTNEKDKQEKIQRRMAKMQMEAIRMDEKRTASIREQANQSVKNTSDLVRRNSLDQANLKTQEQRLANMKSQAQIQINSLSGKKGVDQGVLNSISSSMSGLTVADGGINGMRGINQQLREVSAGARLASEGMRGFGSQMAHNLVKFAEWSIASTLIFGVVNSIKEAIAYITKMDSALSQIRMASGKSAEETSGLTAEYIKLGKELGVTSDIIAKSAVDLYRQGLSTQQVNEAMTSYIKLAKVMGEDLMTTIELGTSASLTFETSVEHIGDVASAVGDSVASSSAEILQIIQKSGSVAQMSSVSLEELATIGSLVASKTRESGSQIGNSLKNIFAKMSQINELGELDTEYGKTIARMEEFGVQVEDSTGTMLGSMEILKNLGSVWDKLSEQQQRYIASALGVHQLNRFSIVIKSLANGAEEYNRVLDIANNSAGSLDKKYEEYSGTIEAANARMKVSWEELYSNTLTSGFIISLVESMSKMVDFVNQTNLVQVSLTVLSVLLASKLIPMFATWVASLASAIPKLIALATTASATSATVATGMTAIQIAMGPVSILLGVLAGGFVYLKAKSEDAIIATENFAKAQKDLNEILGAGGESAKQRLDDITETSDRLKELNGILEKNALYWVEQRRKRDYSSKGLDAFEVKKYKDEIKELEARLTDLGVTEDTVVQAQKELNESYKKSTAYLIPLNKLSNAVASQEEARRVKALAKSYEEWNGIKKKTKEETQQGIIISSQLEDGLKNMHIAYETNTEGLIINGGAILSLITKEEDLANATVLATIKSNKANKDRLEVALKSIQLELKARLALEKALGANPKLDTNKFAPDYYLGSSSGKSSEFLGGFATSVDTQIAEIEKVIQQAERNLLVTPPRIDEDKKEGSTSDILDRYKSQTNVIKELTSAISILEAKKNLQTEGSTEYLRLQANIVTGYKNQQNALKSYSDSIRTTLAKGGLKPEEIEKLNDTLRSNTSEWWALTGSIKTVYDSQKKYNDEVLKKTIEDGEKLVKVLGTDLEQATKAMQSEMEKEAKLASDAHDLEIEKAKTQLDNYEKSIKSQEDTNKLKEIENDILAENLAYQKELDKLAEERSNILANKNVRMINASGTGFDFISDPLALKENSENIAKLAEGHNEKITDLNKNYQDEVINQSRETEKERLKLIVENAEKAKKATEDEYKDRVEALNTFNNEIKTSMENGITIQEGVFGRLLLSDNTYFSTKLAGYRQMVASINAEMAKVASASGQASGVIETQQGQMSPNQDTIKSDMLANSQAWHSASPSEKLRLQAENERLGAMIGATKSNGKWDVLKYHNGIENGLVGGFQMPKQWEQLATLAKGEGVFNQSQMNNVSRFVNSVIPKGGSSPAIGGVNIYGNINLPNVSNANDFMNELNRMRKLNN